MSKCVVIYDNGTGRRGHECYDPRFVDGWLTAEIAKGVRVWLCRRGDVESIRRLE